MKKNKDYFILSGCDMTNNTVTDMEISPSGVLMITVFTLIGGFTVMNAGMSLCEKAVNKIKDKYHKNKNE